MRKYGETIFATETFQATPLMFQRYRWDGDLICRIKKNLGTVDRDVLYSQGYDFGAVFAMELKVSKNKIFKLAEDVNCPEYIIWNTGLYEKANGKWHDVTHRFHETAMFKKYMDRSLPIVYLGECYRSGSCSDLRIGDIVAGCNNRYSITDEDMLEGVITDIFNDGKNIRIRVLKHLCGEWVGGYHTVELYDTKGQRMFKLVRRGE